MFFFWTLKFYGEKVFWRNGSTNKHKASGGNIPAAFSAKAGFDPSSNPGGPAMGSRGVPVKQMPVNLGPPPKAKAKAPAKAEASCLIKTPCIVWDTALN